jgi:DNA-binding LytR/AlgR family response regulator
LLQIDASIHIETVIDSVKSAIDYFKNHTSKIDLIFMDIQLSDGNSFDIFKTVSINTPIIFTTAFHEYALKAFKLNSIDYLLKPIDKSALSKAIEKYKTITNYSATLFEHQFQNLKLHLNETKTFKERFIVHHGNSFVLMNSEDIVAFKKDQLIFAMNEQGEEFITDFESLDELEDFLNPKYFFRANRQFIINIKNIGSFKTDTYGKLNVALKMKSEITVDISREKAGLFKNWLS